MSTHTDLRQISVHDLYRMIHQEEGVDVIDVRTPSEFSEGRIPGAANFPTDSRPLSVLMRMRSAEIVDRPAYVVCRGGCRSAEVCTHFPEANLVNVDGGTDAWAAEEFELERGEVRISIERQVRMVAGALVASGAALALTFHPAFALVSLGVGCGLAIAGATNTCAMGRLLAAMPWNRSKAETTELALQ